MDIGRFDTKNFFFSHIANDGHITQSLPQLLQNHKEEIESFAKVISDKPFLLVSKPRAMLTSSRNYMTRS